MKSWPSSLFVCLSLALVGCADKASTASADDDDDTSEASGTSGDGPWETSAGTGGDDGSTGEAEPEFVPYPARGITLTEVYANQGVAVPIVGPGGTWVDGSGRNAELIQDRNTLLRGYWQLDADFQPREIEALLTLTYADGTEEEARKIIMVEGESRPTDMDTNVWFVVPGELIQPLMKFQIELFETTTGYEDQPDPPVLGFPTSPDYLGIEDTAMELDVVLVPVQHDLGGECPEVPEITEDEAQYLTDALYQHNPVQRVNMTVREPFTYTDDLRGFGGLLGALAQLREEDGASPGAYYYGVVRPCDGGPDGVGGQAISIPGFPDQGNGWARTSVGRWYSSLGSTANTFVHEVGHTQGRRHIACSGSEGGTDPSYPYESGDIGVWGFGVLDFSLHTPTNGKDYMTYCGNTWVSDWTWRAVVPYIKEITTWSLGGAAPAPTGSRILVGLFDENSGEETWFVTQGTVGDRAANPADVFEFAAADGTSRRISSSLGSMGEGGYNVAVQLPDDLVVNDSLAVTRLRGTEATPITNIQVAGQQLQLRQ